MNGAALAALAAVRRQQVLLSAGAVLAITAAAIASRAVQPKDLWFLPPCPFHTLTGLHCPGCGMTRAVLHLFHGDLPEALRCNAPLTLALPCFAVAALWRCWQPVTAPRWKPIYGWWLLVVFVVFGIVRNIPIYPLTMLVP